MQQSRAAGPDGGECKVSLRFTGFEKNPDTIILGYFDFGNARYVEITVPALPKPNISGFKGWKIARDESLMGY